ncbi:GNAT family N-acetyltransferase [Pseudomonas sp. F1_0610]|uniref:GNAT family N-acetyltransferase n=1 Tax=Pseudomonas sp. F1_0610 TaxID=3114284 RepID=UPI0039C3A5B2
MNKSDFYAAETYFWSSISKQTYHPSAHAHCFLSPINTPFFNFLFLHQGATEKGLIKAADFFNQAQQSYITAIEESALSEALQQAIKQQALVFDCCTSAMGLILQQRAKLKFAPNADIRIEANTNLLNWKQPLASAFAIEGDAITSQYQAAHQSALDQHCQFYHFVLFAQQQAACALTLSIQGTVARLDDIGTQTKVQGKGYASRLIEEALCFAQTKGVTHCYLDASNQGLSIYQKLGFKSLFQYHSYLHQEAQ